ncbi:MAG: cytosolic protein [Dehalococcoidales bacterium]|nr:cytosolic protein [Dehalococcoidales bacterium]
MECNIEANKAKCNCTYEPCPRKGKCCECIAFHLQMNELPACVFPPEIERAYDRSFERFAEWVKGRGSGKS